MSRIVGIWQREFTQFWLSPIAYIVITVFLVLTTWLFFTPFFLQGNANMGSYFTLLPWAFLLLLPALTMRQWAEEKNTGTIELLMTLPLREREVVLGKFLAAVSLLAVILLLTLPLTVTVSLLSQNGLDWGVITCMYLGALLLGAGYLAIGGWVSSITQNQIVAFIASIALIFAFIMVGQSFVTLFINKGAGWLVPVLEYIGIANHYSSIARGVIDSRDLVYYFSLMFLFLYLTSRAVENRKWS